MTAITWTFWPGVLLGVGLGFVGGAALVIWLIRKAHPHTDLPQ